MAMARATSTCDSCAARSSVGADDVAIDDDLALSQEIQVHTGPQRPSN